MVSFLATVTSDVYDSPSKVVPSSSNQDISWTSSGASDVLEKDNSFRQYRRLCADIADESSYTGKTKLIQTYLQKGSTGNGFKGDVYLLMKLLLPGVVKTVYNLNNKQLVKLFSQVSTPFLVGTSHLCSMLTASMF